MLIRNSEIETSNLQKNKKLSRTVEDWESGVQEQKWEFETNKSQVETSEIGKWNIVIRKLETRLKKENEIKGTLEELLDI